MSRVHPKQTGRRTMPIISTATPPASLRFYAPLPRIINLVEYQPRGVSSGYVVLPLSDAISKDYHESVDETLTPIGGVGGDDRAFGDARIDPP